MRYKAAYFFTCMAALGAALLIASTPARADETLVFLRHAEKPADGLGQLNCKGLNRALALPKVLRAKFDKPVALFAPNPGFEKDDKGTKFNYVRPLATIEPAAIGLGLPVHASFHYLNIDELERAVLDPAYRGGTVIVAWEHHLARQAVENLMSTLKGDRHSDRPSDRTRDRHGVPVAWADDDFDSMYVVHVQRNKESDQVISVTFERQAQGLDNQPAACLF